MFRHITDPYSNAFFYQPFTNDFPRADIHEMLSPDLLHQVIKGTFKDHLVTWVEEYLVLTHGRARADEIIADIDRRIAVVPSFAGLRRFPEGRGFKQWTGDDSKALMKVYLPAIAGHVPSDMVRAMRAFLEFCYIVRRDVVTEDDLTMLEDALRRFHQYREIFRTSGVRPNGFGLPRQHSLVHYIMCIRLFAALNGLCSSITESKHIKAVKEPWRRSNRYDALGQMLLTNQRLDKLAACRVDFKSRGMLSKPLFSDGLDDLSTNDNDQGVGIDLRPAGIGNEDDGVEEGPRVLAHVDLARKYAKGYPSDLGTLAKRLNQPQLGSMIRNFLQDQLAGRDEPSTSTNAFSMSIQLFCEKIRVHHTATAYFYAPSDPCGVGGMRREMIRATPSWRKGHARQDCVFIETNPHLSGMRGLDVARVLRFLSFKFRGTHYPCALVRWFCRVGDAPDEDTGMWIVEPGVNIDGTAEVSVIHLDCIVRAAHLEPVYGSHFVPNLLEHHHSLDVFKSFYVNKFADHHCFEIVHHD
ncbi:hypothetical protein BD410DRAFT_284313 [Rickenella mellea]|uniref:Uncharacterized protein n=1 Tax=Rickenella mellea TaxID=50990 RepID=A0A4Y7Q3N3_9AGAM|nr:hypothetical protein BD410DRAFT_284313 [Rickenella mellea]